MNPQAEHKPIMVLSREGYEQIAARIGTVREVVSRALARLQQNELILVSSRVITIFDEETLRAFANE